MEHQKALLRFLILFLCLSHVLSSRPLPQYAHLKPGNEGPSVQEFMEVQVTQGLTEGRNNGEGLEVEEESIRVRMDIESNDYSGTAANNRHSPKTPPGRG